MLTCAYVYGSQVVNLGKFTALGKMCLDQSFMAPLGIAMFFASVGLMEGQSPAAAVAAAQDKLKPTLLANWTIWPAANFINFAFIPAEQRILYVNIVYVSGGGGTVPVGWYFLQNIPLDCNGVWAVMYM